jgi:hypothetical protein
MSNPTIPTAEAAEFLGYSQSPVEPALVHPRASRHLGIGLADRVDHDGENELAGVIERGDDPRLKHATTTRATPCDMRHAGTCRTDYFRSSASPANRLELLGGRTRTRTWDPLIKSQLPSRLSYPPRPLTSSIAASTRSGVAGASRRGARR